MQLSDNAKKAGKVGVGGASVLSIFFIFHGDLKASIKTLGDRIVTTEKKVIMLETQEIERDRQYIQSMKRLEKKLDKIDDYLRNPN